MAVIAPHTRATKRPYLGYGLGLRPEYYEDALSGEPAVDWFEIISENFMVKGGKPLHYLDRIGQRYPLVMHGVSLSVGSTDPLNANYLGALKALVTRVQPAWISDHLCWTGHRGQNLHDLMPLPYTGEAVRHVASRVRQVQDYLGRQILLENVSSYVSYCQSEMTEWEFLTAVVEEADCLVLLDLNNIYVSAVNHGFAPQDYLNGVPLTRVQQFHLAGHTHCGDVIIDTHDQPIVTPVWELYSQALARLGPVSTLIERDDKLPAFSQLVAELTEARSLGGAVCSQRRCHA